MPLREGAFIRRFTATDGRRVTLRGPRWSNLDDMLEFINGLVEERAEINATEKKTRDEEMDWLAILITDVERDAKVSVVAEVDDRLVGHVEVRLQGGYSKHKGILGIAIRNGYRDVGIGTEMMTEAEAQARKLGVKLMTLDVFATNGRAIHLYDKLGYGMVGRVPKGFLKEGAYIDDIIMAKEIQSL